MSLPDGLSRRELLGLGVAAGIGMGLPIRAESAEPPPGPTKREEPRNFIFMVSDGMSGGVPALAEPFSRLVRGRGTRWYELLRDPRATLGYFETHALDSMVTDSAAAASAWGSGSRIFNGAINVLPDGTRLTPIAPLMRDTGRRVGLVTTTAVTHATPAGFAAIQPDRGDMQLIAPQYLDVVDVALGGGLKYFDPRLRKDERDVLGEFAAKGYTVCRDRDQLLGIKGVDRVLGLFDKGHMPLTLDQINQAELRRSVPTLAEMTQTALGILSSSGRGFLLQVEGGRVDHAAHRNDAPGMLWDQLAFDDAIGVVLEFLDRNPDTLVVITTDHGNANPGLNGMGKNYGNSDACFERLARATGSLAGIKRQLEKGASAPAPPPDDLVIEAVRGATGIEITRSEAGRVASAVAYDISRKRHTKFGSVLGPVLARYNGIGWTGTEHTSDLAISTALGPGREMFAGLRHHTDAFGCLTKLAGISHRNPHMTPEEARRYLTLGDPSALQRHYARSAA